jgi:LmbE family N-acetylglucosaminyl deacetylase
MLPNPTEPPGTWSAPQNILVILAHPDDPEFFCGATLARWARAGHLITYALLTCGDKGAPPDANPGEVCRTRHAEQNAAAAVIGAQAVHFLDLEDGYLVPDLDLRLEVVRLIRRFRPDILVTCDPETLYPSWAYRLNHPDHRAAGQVVLDAVFPAAGNAHFFPSLQQVEKLAPHTPREVWVSLTNHPDVVLDVTDTWEVKLAALREHKTQIGDPAEFEKRMRSRHTEDSTPESPRYEERFRRLMFT